MLTVYHSLLKIEYIKSYIKALVANMKNLVTNKLKVTPLRRNVYAFKYSKYLYHKLNKNYKNKRVCGNSHGQQFYLKKVGVFFLLLKLNMTDTNAYAS